MIMRRGEAGVRLAVHRRKGCYDQITLLQFGRHVSERRAARVLLPEMKKVLDMKSIRGM